MNSELDPDDLAHPDVVKLVTLLETYTGLKAQDKLRVEYWGTHDEGHVGGPYAWQKRFHDEGARNFERAIIAGNRCVTGRQAISLWAGGTRRADAVRVGDVVLSWDERNQRTKPGVVAEVVRKPSEPIYRVEFSNGETLEAAAGHRLLTNQGWLSVASCIQHIAREQHRRPARAEGDSRYYRTQPDSPDGCPACPRSHDEPLLIASGGDRDGARPAFGVPVCSPTLGVPVSPVESRSRRTHQRRFDGRLSIQDDVRHLVDQCAESSRHDACRLVKSYLTKRRESGRPADASGFRLRSGAEAGRCPDESSLAFVSPLSKSGWCVMRSVQVLKPEPLFDYIIPDWNNYVAANTVNHNSGKTRTCAAEFAMHLTGIYPPWWVGRRFKQATICVAAGRTNEVLRDVVQLGLTGGMKEGTREVAGTGWIPKSTIVDWSFRICGVTNVLDYVRVKHISGGISTAMFKSFDQGAAKFEGGSWDVFWCDEEPEETLVYTEGMTRTLDRKGLIMLSRTPLFGMTPIIEKFLTGGKSGVWYVNASWDDAPHLDREAREQLLGSIPEHERATREKGMPMMGQGAVYPIDEAIIKCDMFKIPNYFRRIVGIDFGIDHPTAAAWLAYDPDTDTIYVTDTHRMSNESAPYHAAAILERSDWIPCAWPHDGDVRDKGTGEVLKERYQDLGVPMLGFSARYSDERGGGMSAEPIIQATIERMRTGRFKVFRHLDMWFEEFRMYHRKDGKVVAKKDDLLKATDYAHMMLRFALTEMEASSDSANRVNYALGVDYDPHQGV